MAEQGGPLWLAKAPNTREVERVHRFVSCFFFNVQQFLLCAWMLFGGPSAFCRRALMEKRLGWLLDLTSVRAWDMALSRGGCAGIK